jgi:acyl-CoA thioesterase
MSEGARARSGAGPAGDDAATAQALAERVVQGMLASDRYSAWLGIEPLVIAPGRSVLRMTVRDDMVNGFGIAHGGITFSLADSALAFATNTGGTVSLALDCSISYPAAARVGDVLTATAEVQSRSSRIAFCDVTVRKADGSVVGHFRGTVYHTPKPHFPEETAP